MMVLQLPLNLINKFKPFLELHHLLHIVTQVQASKWTKEGRRKTDNDSMH